MNPASLKDPGLVSAERLMIDPAAPDSAPVLHTRSPIAIPPEVLDMSSLEALIQAAAATRPWPNVFCRSSVAGPDDVNVKEIHDLDFTGRLEERLRTENLHLMVVRADRFDARIAELLAAFLDLARPVFREAGVRIQDPSAGVFISSPRSIARFHNDLEYGFLHHVHGTKRLHVYPFDEGSLYPSGGSTEARPIRSPSATREYMRRFHEGHWTFSLKPGQTVFIPPLFPHWVEAGSEIAVSLTFVLFGEDGIRRRKVDHINRLIENRGRKAELYNRNHLIDALKCVTYDVLASLGRVKPNH